MSRAILTFESFVVSDSSRAAAEAASAVAENREANPLFLCGPVGSGKTHLLHAVAYAITSHTPRANVLHMPARAFITRMMEAIRRDEMTRFRSSIAALLLDDLPLTTNLNATRQEIYAAIENLRSRKASIVVTCERPPVDLPRQLSETASVVEVGYPDLTARTEIARRESARCHFAMPDPVLRSLAARTAGSPRHLQSAIARMQAAALLSS